MVRSEVLSDAAWERIEPYLPSSQGLRGGRWRDHRQVIEAVAWRFPTRSPWRGPPPGFGPRENPWESPKPRAQGGPPGRPVAAVQAARGAAGGARLRGRRRPPPGPG